MKTDEPILQEFNDSKSLLDDFTAKVERLLGDLLRENKIRAHSISSRVKERGSLQHKVQSSTGSYTKLSDITDVSGLRIITYFADEVDSVAAIVEKEFELDQANSIDKRSLL